MKLKDIILDLFGSLPEPDRPAAIPAVPPRAPRPPRPRAQVPAPAPPRPSAPAPPRTTPPAAPAGRSSVQVAMILRRYGAPYEAVLFTRNRRTMISVSRDRRVLRMNAAFAAADEAVLQQVAALYTPGSRGRKKAAAKAAVQRFINAIPVSDAPVRPRPRRRAHHPLDRVHVERMQAEFDASNRRYFGGRLPRVPIHLSRKMRRRNGHFTSRPLEIVISWRLCVHGVPGEAEQTMRHEMIHLWQYIEGLPVDHGPAFRRMAHRLDVHPRATRPVQWKRGAA